MKKARIHLKWLAIALPVLLSHQLFSQQPIDLKTAMKYTLANHASVKKAQLEIAKGDELVRESLSGGLPQINANANMVNNIAVQPASFQPSFLEASLVSLPKSSSAQNGTQELGYSSTKWCSTRHGCLVCGLPVS